jgi:hypothetical protein
MATIIVVEIMLLLVMIRLIWLIPDMMRRLNRRRGLFWAAPYFRSVQPGCRV